MNNSHNRHLLELEEESGSSQFDSNSDKEKDYGCMQLQPLQRFKKSYSCNNLRSAILPARKMASCSFTNLKDVILDEIHEQCHIDRERISWLKLKQCVEFEWFDKLHHKHPKISQHYLDDIKETAENYTSYTDKVLIKYFNCPFHSDEETQLADAFLSNRTSDDAFVHFDFPYYFARGLHHYVLFSRSNLIETVSDKQMKRLISNYIESDVVDTNEKYEFIYYEEREKLLFFPADRSNNSSDSEGPLLSDILDIDIIPNIIHIFVMIPAEYRIHLSANNATWADESFLWDTAKSIILRKETEKFGREEKWLRKYVQDRQKGKTSKRKTEKKRGFASIRNKILIKEFKCKSRVNVDDKLEAIVDESTPRMLWTENLYPYYLQKGIEHNLVWYLDECVEEKTLQDFIERRIGTNKEYIYWENPLHMKSIPDLDHYQVMSVDKCKYMKNIKHLMHTNKPYKWTEFIENDEIMHKHMCTVDFGWNERICRRYLQEIQETNIRFDSLMDADLRRYFQCKVKKNEKTGKLFIATQAARNYGNYDYEKYVFVSDRYHFHLEHGLKQYLLVVRDDIKWSMNKIRNIIQIELAVQEEEEKSEDKFVFWEKEQKKDLLKNKSYNLWYYHVIFNQQ